MPQPLRAAEARSPPGSTGPPASTARIPRPPPRGRERPATFPTAAVTHPQCGCKRDGPFPGDVPRPARARPRAPAASEVRDRGAQDRAEEPPAGVARPSPGGSAKQGAETTGAGGTASPSAATKATDSSRPPRDCAPPSRRGAHAPGCQPARGAGLPAEPVSGRAGLPPGPRPPFQGCRASLLKARGARSRRGACGAVCEADGRPGASDPSWTPGGS